MNQPAPIRVLIADDSAVARGSLARIFEHEVDIDVVGVARDGNAAVNAVERQELDVVVLDVAMPGMDGLAALPRMLEIRPRLRVIMASLLTQPGAEATLRALELGAADYIAKPSARPGAQGFDSIALELLAKVRGLGRQRSPTAEVSPTPGVPPHGVAMPRSTVATRALVLGASTGGPNAVSMLLEVLGSDFRLPVFLVLHMPPVLTRLLAERFASETGRSCREARDGEEVRPGTTYVAPGGHHMRLRRRDAGPVLEVDQTPPEHYCRPAVDALFRSAAECYGGGVLAVVLTGMGEDGLRGTEALVAQGARVLVQDEASSIVWGMPGAVARAGLASAILPLERIGPEILRVVRESTRTRE